MGPAKTLLRWWLLCVASLVLIACQRDGQATSETPPVIKPPVERATSAWSAGPIVRASADPINEGDSGDSILTVDVTLSVRYSGLVLIDFATDDGTAKVGSDYRRTKGQLRFQSGETHKSIEIPVVGDTIAEGDESFLLKFFVAHTAQLEAPHLVLTIIDDD